MTKKLEYRDWAIPFTVPQGLSKEEVDQYMAEYKIRQATYYDQFENSRDMAKCCRGTALVYAPETTKN
jgi:hypothetical protein